MALPSISSDGLKKMSIEEIYAAYEEIPSRYGFRVYEVNRLFAWLDELLAAGKTETSARVISNVTRLIEQTQTIDEIASYFGNKTVEEQKTLSGMKRFIDLDTRAIANKYIRHKPEHSGVDWIAVAFHNGVVAATASAAQYVPSKTPGYVKDTQEWCTLAAEALAKDLYVMESENAERINLELDEKEGIAALATLKDDIIAALGGTAAVSPMALSADVSRGTIANDGTYLVNNPGTTYHRWECVDAKSGKKMTLDEIAEKYPECSPCAKCNPDPLYEDDESPEETTAQQ